MKSLATQVCLGVSKPSRRLRRIMGKTLIETHVKASKVVGLLSPGKPTTPSKAAESGDAGVAGHECAGDDRRRMFPDQFDILNLRQKAAA